VAAEAGFEDELFAVVGLVELEEEYALPLLVSSAPTPGRPLHTEERS
jgi:hypothetical protein